jgi:dipeptidyl aminopeptidase/acylaminoacyl peptidase
MMVCLALLLPACSSVFFYPQRMLVLTPQVAGLEYEDITLHAADGVRLHAWYLPAQGEMRGTVLFLHGNGGNVSTQLAAVYWLPARGYAVLMPDYRGYGLSEGEAALPGALRDVEAALAWLDARPEVAEHGMVVLGHSLGGVLAVPAVVQSSHRDHLRAAIIVSAFSTYRSIAREKLGQFWLTWPLQWPLSLTVINRYSPLYTIAELAPTPLLIIHSDADVIVPVHHSDVLYAAAREPKMYWRLPGGNHESGLAEEENRGSLVGWLDQVFHHQVSNRE